MKLSIVTTLYKSSDYIDEFYKRITLEAKKITEDYEVIFVDDGSPDDSLSKAINLCDKDTHIKVIELSRNFGHHKAILTGLSHAKGNFVFLIDSDLEEDPELLASFWNEINKDQKFDVVYGIQENRKGKWSEKYSGELFYFIFNSICQIKIPKNLTTCRITTQNYNQSLMLHEEKELFLATLWENTGYRSKPLIVKKKARDKSTYTFSKKISLLVNSMASSTDFPLKAVFYMGLIISILSAFFTTYLILKKIVLDHIFLGWTSVMVSIFFIGGLLMTSLGIIGLYISKIYNEVKKRPRTIIKNIYENKNNE